MEKISRFTHTFDLGGHVALWHSLRMQPVFLNKAVYEQFQQGEYSDALRDELVRKKILTAKEGEDEEVLARIRGNAPEPDVRLGYFILSEIAILPASIVLLVVMLAEAATLIRKT